MRLSTDDGSYQKDGAYGKDTWRSHMPCLPARGAKHFGAFIRRNACRIRMVRTGARLLASSSVPWMPRWICGGKMESLKAKYGPTGLLPTSPMPVPLYGCMHKSDQIEGLLGRFLGFVWLSHQLLVGAVLRGTTSSAHA
ncbi:MAG: hypothetical protein R3E89_14545 [Thiolinea sp.]